MTKKNFQKNLRVGINSHSNFSITRWKEKEKYIPSFPLTIGIVYEVRADVS